MEKVATWMTSPAITISSATLLPDARQMMRQRKIRRLPVVVDDRLVGIVTDDDINRVSDSPATDVRDFNLYHRVKDLPISAIMTREVITASPETPIMDVAKLMLANKISGIPVVDGQRVVGMITESDLFRLIVEMQSGQQR